jgi:hypothetical protein
MKALSLLSMFFLLCGACGKISATPDGNSGNGSGNSLQFKSPIGFEKVSLKNVQSAEVSIFDPIKGSSIAQKFQANNAQKVVLQFAFDEPGAIKTDKMELTGRIAVQYQSDGSAFGQIRNFDIYNYRYIQDSTYKETVYSSVKALTEDWLKTQESK